MVIKCVGLLIWAGLAKTWELEEEDLSENALRTITVDFRSFTSFLNNISVCQNQNTIR